MLLYYIFLVQPLLASHGLIMNATSQGGRRHRSDNASDRRLDSLIASLWLRLLLRSIVGAFSRRHYRASVQYPK
jgi:hypothetical protein